eukprot:GHRQ01037130.1.p1 GENE.GHRQ01037130.1~~GHRQ01037130.1.p1  ORF type:complete len:132 (+),score=23.34 GHRQ01037130.1:316-711(+)
MTLNDPQKQVASLQTVFNPNANNNRHFNTVLQGGLLLPAASLPASCWISYWCCYCCCCQVDWMADKMRERSHTVSATHGDMDETTRESNMREFRAGSTRVLITTDLLAHIGVQQVRGCMLHSGCTFAVHVQ